MAEYIGKDIALAKIDEFAKLNAARGFPVGIFDIEMLRQKIIKMPADDVVPVVHGHWIKTSLMFASSQTGRHGNVHVCANCGEQSGVGFKTPYCAICGAKMDEEVNTTHDN